MERMKMTQMKGGRTGAESTKGGEGVENELKMGFYVFFLDNFFFFSSEFSFRCIVQFVYTIFAYAFVFVARILYNFIFLHCLPLCDNGRSHSTPSVECVGGRIKTERSAASHHILKCILYHVLCGMRRAEVQRTAALSNDMHEHVK